MNKRQRELTKMLKGIGLTVLNCESRNGHYWFTVEAPNGNTRILVMSGTPNDGRSDLNNRAEALRFFRENEKPKSVLADALQAVLPEVKTVKPVVVHRRRRLVLPSPPPMVAETSDPPPAPVAPPQLIAEPPAPEPQEPAPPSPTMRTSRRPIERRNLTQLEFYRLCEWLKQINFEEYPTLVALAEKATTDLNFDTSESSIGAALEATGRVLPRRAPVLPMAPTHIIARELAMVMKELGREPSPEFKALVERFKLEV